MIWDFGHLVRDACLYFVVLVVVWVTLLLPTPWRELALAAEVQLYAAGWWEASNAAMANAWRSFQWGPLKLPAGVFHDWSRREWGDLGSSAVGIALAAVLGAALYFHLT